MRPESSVAGEPAMGRARTGLLASGVRRLEERTLLVLMIPMLGGVAGVLWHLSRFSSDLIEATAIAEAARTSKAVASVRTLYTSEVVRRARSHGTEVAHDYATKDGAIPLPAAFSVKLGALLGEDDSGALVRLYSDYPFPWRTDGGPQDPFQADALAALRANPERPFHRFESIDGRRALRYATADRMQASCVSCHNRHPESPKTDWQEGDVRGVLEVVRPVDGIIAQTNLHLRDSFVLLMILAGLGFGVVAHLVLRTRNRTEEVGDPNHHPATGADEDPDDGPGDRRFQARILLLSVAVAAAVVTFDVLNPMAVAAGVPYVVLVLVSLWSRRQSHTYMAAIVGTLLAVLGFVVSPPGGEFWHAITNRVLAIFAIWVTAILCLSQKRRMSEHVRLVAKKETAELESRLTRAALQRTEELEARTRAIVDTAADGIITIDQRGTIESFNRAAEQIFGYTANEVLGQNVNVLMPTSERAAHDEHLQRYLETDRESILGNRREVLGRRKDGTTFPMDLHVSEIVLGERRMYTGIVRDITSRKQSEAQLEGLHRSLLDASRRAGMTEVATGVLHNVDNVLNSINVSTTVLADRIRQSRVSGLAKATALLQQHVDDLPAFLDHDEKGKKLPGYFVKLSEHLAAEQEAALAEIESLGKNVQHICEIVRMQQTHAGASGVPEVISIADIVDDALRMNSNALQRHDVRIVCEYEDVPNALIDKHKVLQILVNLLRNAKDALRDADRGRKVLTLRIRREGDDRVRIEVVDNGVGISSDTVTKLFAHGFSTKKDGHGFGLHSSALAAVELGGTLSAHSDGPQRGATFTLELPLNRTEVSQ